MTAELRRNTPAMIQRFSEAPGNTRLMFFGYCLTGPPASYPKVLWSIILGAFVVWSGVVAPSLWQFSRGAVYYAASLLLLMIATYLRIACVDPGIIPRNAPRFQPKSRDTGDNSTAAINARFSSRMCKHCGIEKPPMAMRRGDTPDATRPSRRGSRRWRRKRTASPR